jgi:folylpolyglutamate synthase/dihydropteroate synthase
LNQKQEFEQLHIVLGVVNDKDLEEILPLFPRNAIYYFSKPNNPRGDNNLSRQSKSKRPNRSSIQFNYNSLQKSPSNMDSDVAAAPFCSCRNIVIIFIFACIFKKEAYICTRNEEQSN